MNAEQLWDTTMNPEFRTLRQVSIDNLTEADRIFSMLMGDEVPPRREFIEKKSAEAIEKNANGFRGTIESMAKMIGKWNEAIN